MHSPTQIEIWFFQYYIQLNFKGIIKSAALQTLTLATGDRLSLVLFIIHSLSW